MIQVEQCFGHWASATGGKSSFQAPVKVRYQRNGLLEIGIGYEGRRIQGHHSKAASQLADTTETRARI